MFSDRLMHVVREEYPDIDVLRFISLEQLKGLSGRKRALVQVVITDETSALALLRDQRALGALNPSVVFGVGYHSTDTARAIVAESAGSGVKLHCLPMRSSVDAWVAAFRLMALGEDFVPGELLKPQELPQATDAVRSVAVGAPAQAEPAAQTAGNPMENLTEREQEILELMSCGAPNKAIARQLGLSEHTIKLHVHHIFGKIGVRNRTSASHWYLSQTQETMKEHRR